MVTCFKTVRLKVNIIASFRAMSTTFKRESVILEPIKPNTDWKQRNQTNFEKIKNNKFENKEWIQPSCDHRTYKYLKLKNGIKVLLIYDNKKERKSFENNAYNAHSDKSEESSKQKNSKTDGNNYYDVALCVNRGYYSDPDSYPGIAHYCEHMLFMGNEKYPKENSYEEWLSDQGGSANAATYNLFTNYVFDIAPKGKDLLFEALDRFAHNFISPLFNQSSSERELNAIENEFQFGKTDDAYKQWLVLKRHVLRRSDIPYFKFGAGNKSTLNDENINDELIKYWTQNYLPQNMSLCVLSDVDLNDLSAFVIELFEQIKIPKNYIPVEPNIQTKVKNVNDENPLRLEPNILRPVYGKLFRVNAVKDGYYLDIYWMLNGTECTKHYDSSPTCFISELLGHEGKGSLHEKLNKLNFINSVECGYETDPEALNEYFEMFEINLELTQKGYDNVYTIIDYIFEYLAMLKQALISAVNGNNKKKSDDNIVSIEEYFIESKLLGEIAFNYANNTNGWRMVDELSIKMHQYPIHHLLSSDYLYWRYDPRLVLASLNELTPNRCTMMMLSIDAIDYKHSQMTNLPSIKSRKQMIEPIFDTKYSMEDIPKKYITKWNETYNFEKFSFHLPMKNEFIPTNLSLISDSEFENQSNHFLKIENVESFGPELLVYNECMKLYYKLDRTYYLPKSYINLVFEHDKIWSKDAKNIAALQVFVDMFDNYYANDSYLPQQAGLHYELESIWRGLKLKIYGYSDKLIAYFTTLIDEIKNFQLDKDTFKTQKNALIRAYKNELVDTEDHLSYIARICIIYNSETIEAKLSAAQNLTLSDIENVRDLIFKYHQNNLRIYGLFTGNIKQEIVQNKCANYLIAACNIEKTKNENVAMYEKFVQLQKEQKFLSQSDHQNIKYFFSQCNVQSIVLPINIFSFYSQVCVSEDEENSGVLVLYQMDNVPIDDNDGSGMGILCSLLRTILSEPFYDHLRTKQQLGYEVSVDYQTVANIPFLKFQIVSSSHNPHYLTLQILKFVNCVFVNEYLNDILKRDNFEKIDDFIDSAIRSRKIECSSLKSRHNLYWSELFSYNTFEFDAKLKEVAQLKTFNFERIRALYEEKLMIENGKSKCAVFQVWKQENEESKDEENGNNDHDIKDLDELNQRLCDDLSLTNCDIRWNEIDNIETWQNSLNCLPSYL